MISDIYKLPHNHSAIMGDYMNEFHARARHYMGKGIEHDDIISTTLSNKIRYVLDDANSLYNICYLFFSIMALMFPIFYCLLLLNVIKQNQDLMNILRSVTLNKKQIGLTMILALICIYIFSVMGFVYFSQFYDNYAENADFITYCETLYDCFFSTLNIGIRMGGGIGEGIMSASKDTGLYYYRIVFDILFFVIIILLLLNILFGIIIDTFAELRVKR